MVYRSGTNKEIVYAPLKSRCEHGCDASSSSSPVKINMRSEIESHVLHDLTYAVIHLANHAMIKLLLFVLQQFHTAKKDDGREAVVVLFVLSNHVAVIIGT
jgi:Condensin II non structural maintenance of chromosomes subunit